MSKGISLHLGLNTVDSKHYKDANDKPWDGRLDACENDARAMQHLADTQGFSSTLLLTQAASSQNLIQAINKAAQTLKSGDLFFLSFSGHGGQYEDDNGDENPQEGNSFLGRNELTGKDEWMGVGPKDETWCLYDRQLLDDQIYDCLAQMKSGVRVLVVSDSCHSGSVVKDLELAKRLPQFRYIPPQNVIKTIAANPEIYQNVRTSRRALRTARANVSASVILLAGCQEGQLSGDGPANGNGVFTSTLLNVWRSGKFSNHYDFIQRIAQQIPPPEHIFYKQTPVLYKTGVANPKFEAQKPFTI